MKPIIERLLTKTRVADSSNCWVWLGSKSKKGYGRIGAGRRGQCPKLVHRVSYEWFVGPIAKGMTIDHMCNNPSCINPIHLEQATQKDNNMRGMSLPAKYARSDVCMRGHLFDGHNGYGRTCSICKKVFDRRYYLKKIGRLHEAPNL